MKKNDRVQKQAIQTIDKLRAIIRHIKNVQDNCILLGESLINNGEIELGKQLIAHGFIHDASKFNGIEFDFIDPVVPKEDIVKLKFKLAIYQHQKTNPHHVEFWNNGIKEMPSVYLAELVCDFKSRSEEFGTDIREYIKNIALPKWKISKEDLVYKEVIRFVDILCNKPFTEIK